jgi:hypothetical protein
MKSLFFIFIFSICSLVVCAQEVQIDTFQYRQNGTNIPILGAVFKSPSELIRQQDILDPRMYPIVVLPRPVLSKVMSVANRQSILNDSLTLLGVRLQDQDKLNQLEIAKKDKIIQYQKEFIEFSDKNRQMLNESVTNLNNQLSETRKLARDTGRASRAQKWWAYVVGGGLGFGLGAVLGILVAK